jgi:SAM-dependent methyltransferase
MQEFVQHGLKRTIPDLLDFPQNMGYQLNLGAGNYHIKGAVSLDYPDWDADKDPIPYHDGTVSGIWALHFLEHLRDPVAMLREMQRVTYEGAVINILVPHAFSEMAHHDIDHKHTFTEETWRKIFDNRFYAKQNVGGAWRFRIHANFLLGVTHRNLANFVQLVRE